ncbi:MAG TPA: ImmA/IrrE family metallo-endopeptidase [Candidatus Aquicultor sp.]|jgi:Zn-dependent peptidase ImmA (M78 family)
MLSPDEIRIAEEAAKDVIIQSFGSIDSLELPIDLNVILEANALILKKGMFAESNVSGAFDRRSSTIYIAMDEPPERQAFTVAHEIGHFKLHANMDTELLYRQTMQFATAEIEKQEQIANWFAAALLMPADAVMRLWKTTKDVDELSRIFGVSKSAMYFRLINLKLL